MAIAGENFLVVRMFPAMTAEIDGEDVKPTYEGPRNIPVPARREHDPQLTQTGDFEAQVTWAIGLDEEHPFTATASSDELVVETGTVKVTASNDELVVEISAVLGDLVGVTAARSRRSGYRRAQAAAARSLRCRGGIPLDVLDVDPVRREEGADPKRFAADVFRPVSRAGGNDHQISGANLMGLAVHANLSDAGLEEDHLVDLVAVQRNRVADGDLFDDDGDVRVLVRDEGPSGARPPVVGIVGIGKGLQVQIAMQAHAPILTACR